MHEGSNGDMQLGPFTAAFLMRLNVPASSHPLLEKLTKIVLRADKLPDGWRLSPIGSKATFTVTENREGAFIRAAANGSVQLLASYAKDEWNTNDLYGALAALWRAEHTLRKWRLFVLPAELLARLATRSNSGSAQLDLPPKYSEVTAHYELPIELFHAFLGDDLVYSTALLRYSPEDYAAAYQETYKNVIESLVGNRSRAVILDLGSGWGMFSRYVMDESEHSVYAITMSKPQVEYMKNQLARYMPGRLTIIEGNFTDGDVLPSSADALVSLETIEHVKTEDRGPLLRMLGRKYPNSPLLLQFTASPSWTGLQKRGKASAGNSVIFSGSTELPTLRQVMADCRRAGYRLVDIQDLTAEYSAITLGWRARFVRNTPELGKQLPVQFLRAWDFYLAGLTTALGQRTLLNYRLILQRE